MKNLTLILFLTLTYPILGQVNYTYYQKSELEEDIDFLAEKLTNIHPLLQNSEEKNKWSKNFTSLKKSLKDSLTQNEFYITLASTLATLEDGHTGMIMPFNQRIKYSKAGGTAFPFFVDIKDYSIYNKFYCGNDSTLFKGGEEILKINGISSRDMVSNIQKIFGGKSLAIRQNQVAYNFRFYIWMFYGFEDDYEIEYKNSQNQTLTVIVPGISSKDFRKNLKRRPKADNKLYNLQIDDNRKTATLKIKSFADLKGFCSFARNAFSKISPHKVENLIIDVRNNSGGRSIVVDSLMTYLTDKQYTQYKKIETRISKELKDRYKKRYPNRVDWINQYSNDELVTQEKNIVKPGKNNLRFKGKLYLLINQRSYSAAATFAGLYKELKMGSIIGEETGGTISYYGDFWMMQTPNTKIRFHISPKRFIQYGGNDLNRGVIPDYIIEDKKNSVLDFTYDIINN